MDPVRLVSTLIGLLIIVSAIYWAARILMVKGTDPPYLARFIFRTCRNGLHVVGDAMRNTEKRRQLWALYVPFSLLSILGCTIAIATLGYTLLLYGVTQNSMSTAYVNSVSSMSVLGIAGQPKTLLETTIGGIEAFTGPIFLALLIAYTVSIYSAYSDRREKIDEMKTLQGESDNGVELLLSAVHGDGIHSLDSLWRSWAAEFKKLEKIYRTVDGYLLFFAPEMSTHWSVDAPTVLDAAALRNTLVAGPPDQEAADCLDQGSIAIASLAQHYRHRVISLHTYPERRPIDRLEFDYCAESLAVAGVATSSDLDRAWNEFQAFRSHYAEHVATLTRMLPHYEKV